MLDWNGSLLPGGSLQDLVDAIEDRAVTKFVAARRQKRVMQHTVADAARAADALARLDQALRRLP